MLCQNLRAVWYLFVRLKNKIGQCKGPYNLHANLSFKPPECQDSDSVRGPVMYADLSLHLCIHMYVLTMQLLLLLFQFLSVSSREHPMDLITFNSMRQLPGNSFDLDDQALSQAASHPS